MDITSFANTISELSIFASNLLTETHLAFNDNLISEEEYSGYINQYDELHNLIRYFNNGETSPNEFLRNLYYITKSYERLGDTTYTKSMFDLLADTYIELAEINLCRKDA